MFFITSWCKPSKTDQSGKICIRAICVRSFFSKMHTLANLFVFATAELKNVLF